MMEQISKNNADNSSKTSSRRKFIKNCLAATGAVTLGGWSLHALANRNSIEGVASANRPRYLELARSGELERRERALWAKMERCDLCPRQCGVNRTVGRTGICGIGDTFRVSSHMPHFGEEAPLTGRRGSGTIFFSNCNLLCIFCQNWEINHRGDGRITTHTALANMMLGLQRRGCHNINFVTPTHVVPHILSAVRIAVDNGLNIPLLYNTGGFESLEVIELLDGIMDVYLPDFKFQCNEIGMRLAQNARDYPTHAAAAIKEMHRQVGTLQTTNNIATRGLLIRHLVLPENNAGTDVFVRWVADELGTDTHVNIMGQYRPMFRANEFPPLNRRVTPAELRQAMQWAREAGLHNFH